MHQATNAGFSLVNDIRVVEAPAEGAGEVERFLSRWEDALRSLQDGAFAAEQGNGPPVEQAATRFEQGIAGGAEIAPTSRRRTAPPWLSPAAPQR